MENEGKQELGEEGKTTNNFWDEDDTSFITDYAENIPQHPIQDANSIPDEEVLWEPIPEITQNSATLSESKVEEALIALMKTYRLRGNEEIMHLSSHQIKECTSFSEQEVAEFLFHISIRLCANIVTTSVSEMKKDPLWGSRLSLGCKILDKFFKGGIPSRGLIEFVGAAGAGKTQICIQLLFQSMLKKEDGGLDGNCCLIFTEGAPPWKRLQKIQTCYQEKYSYLKKLDGRFHLEKVSTIEELSEFLGNTEKLPSLLQKNNVKLVVIDSIAALFRFEFTQKDDFVARSSFLWDYGSRLKLLSDKFGVPVIIVNQVSDYMDELDSVESRVIPALGLVWSHCISHRILVRKSTQKRTFENSKIELVIRELHVILSSFLPNWSCNFYVDNDGVHGVE